MFVYNFFFCDVGGLIEVEMKYGTLKIRERTEICFSLRLSRFSTFWEREKRTTIRDFFFSEKEYTFGERERE